MEMRRIRSKTTPKKRSIRKSWDSKLTTKRGRSFTHQKQAAIYSVNQFFEKEDLHYKKHGEFLIPIEKVR